MKIEDIAEEYLRYLENDRNYRDMKKVRQRVGYLVKFWLGRHVESLKYKDITDFVEDLKSRNCQPSYINTRLSSIRSFLRFCVKHDLKVMDINKIEYITVEDKIVRFLNKEQIAKIMGFFKGDSLIDYRNRAFIACMLDSGMRISEVLDRSRSELPKIYKGKCAILGKGGKERNVFFSWSIHYIKAYMRQRQDNCEAIFVTHWPLHQEKRLSAWAMQKWFTIIRKKTGIGNFLVTHTLRKTAANIWRGNGMDIKDVSQLLGHKSIKVTEKFYVGIDWERLEKNHLKYSRV